MPIEFFPESNALPVGSEPLIEQKAGALSGIGSAIVNAPPRAALQAAENVHIMATGIEPGLSTEQRDAQFKRIEDSYKPYIEALSPHSWDTGTAGHIVSGFLEAMSALATRGGPKALVSAATMNESTGLVRDGVAADTAAGVGVLAGGVNAVGFTIPFLGKSLASKVVFGAGSNVALGAGQEAFARHMLEGEYGDLAKRYDPFNAQSRILDALIGGAFGGLAHHLDGNGARLPADVADAVLALNRSRQAERDALPGRPVTGADLQAHTEALSKATHQMADGLAVDVAGQLLGRRFVEDKFMVEERARLARLADEVKDRALGTGYLPGDIPRADTLTAGKRTVETRFANYLADNFQAARKRYDQLPETAGGKIINTDEVRRLSDDFARDRESAATLSSAVHEPASWFTKRMYADKLKEQPKAGEDPVVVFTAGGTGAGKSTAIANAGAGMLARAQLIYDSNGNGFDSTVQKIYQARAAGKEVKYLFVVRDPVDALVNGSLKRAENPKNNGRTVPIREHIATHVGSAETLPKLIEHFKGDPGVTFAIIDNTHGQGQARIGSLETIQRLHFTDLEKRLYAALEKEYQQGRISLATYSGTKGLDAAAKRPAAQRGDRQPEQKDATPGGKEAGREAVARPDDIRVPDVPDMTKALEGSKALDLGHTATVTTERGSKIGVRYALIEAADLRTSHTDSMQAAGNFDARLQPRERDRAASEAQVARIEGGLDFNRVADNPTAADGAPIVGPDDQVESGNARSIAIRRAYKSGKAADYRAKLTQRAADLGLDPQIAAAMKEPVLIRQRVSSVPDRARFAIEANEQAQARMSLTEQARSDASRIESLDGLEMNEDGSINMRESQGFIRRFVNDAVAPTDQGAMIRPDGSLSTEGVSRVRNAIFARAYGDPELVSMLVEGADQNVRNLLGGLARAAGDMADIREGAREGYYHPLDISNDVAAAARLYAEIKGSGNTVDGYLAHQVLFDPVSQLSQELIKAFDLHARSGKRIGELLTNYAHIVRDQGSPRQSALIPESGTGLSRESIVAEAAKQLKPDQTRDTASGNEKPIAKAQPSKEGDTVEGKQAAAVVASRPDLLVPFDESTVVSGTEALALADEQLKVAEHMAGMIDQVTADITPATLNAAEGGSEYLAADRKRAFNPDQGTLDLTERADTPAAAVQASIRSVEQLARQPSELAREVAKGFKNAGSAAIIGQKIRNVHDLAAAAQIYRNPNFETLRYVFVKNGKVIHATGVSSRMVSETQAFADPKHGDLTDVGSLAAYIDRLGADGVYLVHNHPSGNPRPSEADIRLTKFMWGALGPEKFLGHVVVNHRHYATIGGPDLKKEITHDFAIHGIENENLRTRPIDHPVLDELISQPADVARVGSMMRDLTQRDSFVMIGRQAEGRVSGVVEVPMAWIKRNPLRLLAEARRYKLNSGAADLFLVGPTELQEKFRLMQGVSSGILLDVVDWSGKHSMRSHPNVSMMPGTVEGVARERVKSETVADNTAGYDAGEPVLGGLSQEQIDHMRGLVREKLRYLQSLKLRGMDPALNPMNDQELAREATRRAAEDLVADAQAKKRRTQLAILAADRTATLQDAHADGPMRGLVALMVRDKADRANTQSFESHEMATRAWALGRLMPALEATNPKLFGIIEDRQGWRDLVHEVFGEDTGNAKAKAGAKAWLEVMEDLRNQANYAGFEIGKLDSYHLPQLHDRKAVVAAGVEQWVADVLPKLDRNRYVKENGMRYTDADLQDFLEHAYESIATNGMNKLEPGQFRGSQNVAGKGREHRQIHFAKADDYLDYLNQYGGTGSLHHVITSHVTQMARDIALVDTFGPNPGRSFQTLLDRAMIAGDTDTANFAQNLFHEISGASVPGELPTWAEWSQGARNLLVSAKLGGAALSSLTDNATLHITAQLNNLSSMQLARNQLQALNPLTKADRDIARANGLGLDIFAQSLTRWGEDGLGGTITGKLAAGTLRASGLQALTEANKRAYGITMMSAIGKLVRDRGFETLAESDNRILGSKGITAADWSIYKKAQLENWGAGNDTILSPQSIARIPDRELVAIDPSIPPAMQRNRAITRLLGAVLEETDTAVITSGYRERALIRQGTTGGTIAGELLRHIGLFKSFPIAMIARHWTRALSMPSTAGKVAYASALFTGLTILGAVAMTVKDLAAGKDPRSLKDPRTWLAAMAQGGGLGIYGDYMFSDQSRYGNSLVASVAGPAAGVAEDFYKLTAGNIHQAIRGEATHLPAEALQFVKGNAPLINLWYTKAALDRWILNDFQEYLSPGYLSRVRETTRKNTGQDMWWAPGETTPGRSPDWHAMTEAP